MESIRQQWNDTRNNFFQTREDDIKQKAAMQLQQNNGLLQAIAQENSNLHGLKQSLLSKIVKRETRLSLRKKQLEENNKGLEKMVAFPLFTVPQVIDESFERVLVTTLDDIIAKNGANLQSMEENIQNGKRLMSNWRELSICRKDFERAPPLHSPIPTHIPSSPLPPSALPTSLRASGREHSMEDTMSSGATDEAQEAELHSGDNSLCPSPLYNCTNNSLSP